MKMTLNWKSLFTLKMLCYNILALSDFTWIIMNTDANIKENKQGKLQRSKNNQLSLLLTSVKTRLMSALVMIALMWFVLGKLL